MEITVTCAPWASFRRRASSRAYSSNGLTIDSTPSRIKVLVLGLIRTFVVSGTCFTQTTILISHPFSYESSLLSLLGDLESWGF